MTWLITARTAHTVHTYSAIGSLAALMDAAFDAGALGVTVMVAP
jgi:hypothetical protein